MALKRKYQYSREEILRDVRPLGARVSEGLKKPEISCSIFAMAAGGIYIDPMLSLFSDLIFFIAFFYFLWLYFTPLILPFKLPQSTGLKDKHNIVPGGGTKKAEGILYLGNERDSGEEIWFNNTDARTHILYLGTTGSGKTEGLKSLCVNTLCWGSGFIYIDGKADTDLWSGLSNMVRRFGRDDDMLIMNYMTGGLGGRVASNTMNPFSSGSASYLVNMLVSLMPDAEGDNAMWKDRAVALVSSLMPCLVWKRENQNIPLSISVIRKYLGFGDVIRLSRDEAVPASLREGIHGYLSELPGYVDEAFDDDGNEKPMPPDAPQVDTSTPRQQHGYLSMQFTRSMQSLGDDYGFIFDTQAADIDMMDVVLNRRIMITLIPALEKSSDETANLGKIISSTLKGMMGSTLGHTVEGSSETAIENKPTNSPTPYMAIFDEVGYYAAAGMAVMAAQARSLGFCLVYAAQDLPAMEKRVKEEARSITANCNIKLFGKLEDPTQTKEFFEKTVGQAMVTEVSGFQSQGGTSYMDGNQASVQVRARVDYDDLKAFTEGTAICAFGERIVDMQIYYSNPGMAKAMRVQRFLAIPPPNEDVLKSMKAMDGILKRIRNPQWDPEKMSETSNSADEIDVLAEGFSMGKRANVSLIESAIMAIASIAESSGGISKEKFEQAELEKAQGTATPPTAESSPAVAETPQQETTTPAPAKEAGGPLSWMDVIGGGSTDTAEQTATPTDAAPAIETTSIAPPSDASGDSAFAWDNIMGLNSEVSVEQVPIEPETPPAMPTDAPIPEPAVTATPTEQQAAPPPVAPTEPIVAQTAQEEASGALSWGNIMSATEGSDANVENTQTTPAMPPAPAEIQAAPVIEPAIAEQNNVQTAQAQTPLPAVNIPETPPAMPSIPPVAQQVPPQPIEQPHLQQASTHTAQHSEGQILNEKKEMNWADVIGSALPTEEEDEGTEETIGETGRPIN